MNNKIIEHLKTRTNQNPRGDLDSRILSWLDKNKDGPRSMEDLRESVSGSSAGLYRAVYRLASQQKIGFACSTYHDVSAVSGGLFHRGTRVLFWHPENKLSAPVKERWIDESAPLEQGRLFGADLANLTIEQLDDLAVKIKRIQIDRGVASRYPCIPKEHRDKLGDVFAGIGITDPVYFAHSDDDISFITYTAVQAMPIDIVLDAGHGPVRFNCRNLTIFGKAIVAATDSMFGGE